MGIVCPAGSVGESNIAVDAVCIISWVRVVRGFVICSGQGIWYELVFWSLEQVWVVGRGVVFCL